MSIESHQPAKEHPQSAAHLKGEFLQHRNDGHTDSADFEVIKQRAFKKQVFKLFVDYFCIDQMVPLKEIIHNVEKTIILRTLDRFGGNQRVAARFLGIKYTTLNEKVKRYNIHFEKKAL